MKNLWRKTIFVVALLFPLTSLASEGWSWTIEPTPGALNNIVNETGETPENYNNGDLSDAIILSEIMPNPEGTDTDTEWIEIYNTGTSNVDLGNWSVDDQEGGSNPYVFPADTIIEAQDFLVIYRSESDLALNNDTDEVRLFDFENTLQDSVIYDGSPEGESYARISLEGTSSGLLSWLIPQAKAAEWHEASWQWTNDITQGFTNPIYTFIQGEIKEVIPFENKITLTQDDGNTIELSLDEIELNPELKNSIFTPGNIINGYAIHVKEQTYKLKSFGELLTASPTASSKTSEKTLLFLGIILCLGGIFAYKTWNTSLTKKSPTF